MCLYPRLIDNPKYKKNKKNGGIIPPIKDKRVKLVPIGCGNCFECVKQKTRQWQVRLTEEIRHYNTCKFVTFTFDNEHLHELEEEISYTKTRESVRKVIIDKNGKIRRYWNYTLTKNPELTGYNLDNRVATVATRRFLERWRKQYGKSIKHWCVTEIGTKSTERLHIHAIIFTEKKEEEIKKIWQYGNVFIGEYCNESTINYIVKYLHKKDSKHKEYKSIVLCSSGLGKNYLDRNQSKNNIYKGKDTNTLYRTKSRLRLPLPIYYRNKIYSEEERELLWLYKLDEQLRYVDGIKIDISKTEEHYYKKLEMARAKNKELGFGDNTINWERRKYERQRRKLKQKHRKKAVSPTA